MIDELESALSLDRLSRFYAAFGGDRDRSLELFRLNVRASAEFLPGLHLWEVSLRNRLDAVLVERYGPDWLIGIAAHQREFTVRHRRDVEKAVLALKHRYSPRPQFHGAIVSELGAGFWVGFLSHSYAGKLGFAAALGRVFPFHSMPEIAEVHRMADELRRLRNRIAHHEPIVWLDLEQRLADLDLMLSGLSPSALDLFLEGSQLSDTIERIRRMTFRPE